MAPKLISNSDRYRWFLTQKIDLKDDFESIYVAQNCQKKLQCNFCEEYGNFLSNSVDLIQNLPMLLVSSAQRGKKWQAKRWSRVTYPPTYYHFTFQAIRICRLYVESLNLHVLIQCNFWLKNIFVLPLTRSPLTWLTLTWLPLTWSLLTWFSLMLLPLILFSLTLFPITWCHYKMVSIYKIYHKSTRKWENLR